MPSPIEKLLLKKYKKSAKKLEFSYLMISLFLALVPGMFINAEAQSCNTCDFTFNSTGGPTIPNNANGIRVCIAANRTTAINFNNAQNVIICIEQGVTVNADFNSLSSLATINNFGIFTARNDYNGNWTINNSGTLTVNFANLNSGRTINSTGTFIRNGDFTINGSLNLSGTSSVSGNFTVNGGAQVSNSGTLGVGGNYQSNGQTNSSAGTINIGGNLTNNGSGSFSVSGGNIGGNVQNDGNIAIHGFLDIAGNLTMNGGANVSAGDNNQPNYLNVGGDITGAGCLNGNNGILFTNKFQTSGGICRNGQVFIGQRTGCLEIIELPAIASGSEQVFERIYIFRCSTGWTVPALSEDEEPFDEAEILVVAGGGGGGRGTSAGGGGAGGLIYNSSVNLNPGDVLPVIVGTGGLGSTSINSRGGNGTNSSFLNFVAVGGGGGGSNSNGVLSGNPGGSGGGGANAGGSGGNNQAGQGNRGGQANNSGGGNRSGAGGGGAGGAAPNVANGNGNPGGPGGDGSAQSISGELVIYSGGGGGTGQNTPGDGGSGVGGNGNNSGNGGNGRTPGSGGGAGSLGGGNGTDGIVIIRKRFVITPVEYLYFNGSFNSSQRAVTLQWATGKEWENSHFEIERAINQVQDFQTIGEVEGAGFSDVPVSYTFVDDRLPMAGGMAYYRLRQVDFDGTYAYSDVVGVRTFPQQTDGKVWVTYPNPTTGHAFTLDLLNTDSYQDESLQIHLIATTGKKFTISGRNLTEISREIGQNLQILERGVYILEVRWGNKIEIHKIYKM
ncbi:T9SS type A sorting domain-containing protein [Mongoliitalea daihaiensis]|uniref:T9SS type A sorting domain-containing protein n=1 Tax=Mongoliitalea daihaiensis TaxID=2782006 RepID=UPI0021D45057|nr:T9SS type A sorting domain-containing protein [Mongoliitalea daihaiensis]UJP66050.1 T9SS type A sorting domain-containing protein [Mongoliitalea daihaiensis]